jgi:uncharacterized damage-inducible protein DinB
MPDEAAQFAVVLDRIGRDVLIQLSGVSPEDLNRPLDIPETNSLFALATHLVGSGEFWVLAIVGGQSIQRDREAEFRATGTLNELVNRYESWLAAIHELLDNLPDAEMKRVIEAPAARRPFFKDEVITVRDCLLHTVEHCALHQGHIQITRQLLTASSPKTFF